MRDEKGPFVFTHVWRWVTRLPKRHGQACRILAASVGCRAPLTFKIRRRVVEKGAWWGGMGSVLVEFEDGERVVTSRYAVRRKQDG